MAELAIPLIALGSMYVMSNQDKQKKTCGPKGMRICQIQRIMHLLKMNSPMSIHASRP